MSGNALSPSERPAERVEQAMQSAAHLTADRTGLRSREKSFELCSSAATHISKLLDFMKRDQLLLIWQRLADEGDGFLLPRQPELGEILAKRL